jgi:hypothetical protein
MYKPLNGDLGVRKDALQSYSYEYEEFGPCSIAVVIRELFVITVTLDPGVAEPANDAELDSGALPQIHHEQEGDAWTG